MRRSIYCVLLVAILFSAPIIAQSNTGTISGRVMDETGAVLPGVTVTITNLERGSIRTLVSGDEGIYRASALTLGSYEIQAELMGFRTAIRSGITLTVGQEAVVDLTLQVGEISERVVVTGEAALVSTTSSSMSQLVSSRQIQDLPLNGRDYVQLATLQPGVLVAQTGARVSGGDSSGAIGRGLGVKLSVSGAKTNSNAFLLDGTDVNDYANTTPGAITGANLGVEAIQEFRVLTNTYSAEYGRSAGGTITSISRSGTNEHHGSIFYFHRNDNFDAPNFFDNAFGLDKPEFRRHQYGAAAGGPIIENKLFYFGNYEALRELLGRTSSSRVPSLDARNGIIVGEPGPIAIDPGTQVVLDTYPLPNGTVSGNTARYNIATDSETEQDFIVGKVDHELNDSHSYFVRYTFDDAAITREDGLGINENAAASRRQFVSINFKSILSPTLLNSPTFAFNRTNARNGELTPIVDLPIGLTFIPGRPAGSTSTSGLSTLPGGPFSADLDSFIYNVFQFRDDVNWNRGQHSIKFGINLERLQTNINSTNQENGNWRFGSVKALLQNSGNRFRTMIPGSDTIRGLRQSLIGFYINDDFQLSNRLTLNIGLRYEFTTELSEVNGKLSNLRNSLTDADFTVGKAFENPSLTNFAPRIGFAWDPAGDGKTAIRAGFGIFHDQILSHYFSGGFAIRVPPFFTRGNLQPSNGLEDGDFPTGAFEKFATVEARQEGEYFEFKPSQPYAMQFNLNIQRELTPDTVVSVGYVGYRGIHMKRIAEDGNIRIPRVGDGNPTTPVAVGTFNGQSGILHFVDGDPRRNDAWGGAAKGADMDSQSHYHGLQLGFNKRFSRGLQAQVSYTFSKSLDDSSGIFNEKDLSNGDTNPFFYDSGFNRALSDYNVRHNFVLNYTYDLPVPEMSGAAGKILNGWQWSGIVLAATGNPFSVYLDSDQANTLTGRTPGGQKPSVAGSGRIESTGEPSQWFSTDQFIFPDAGYLGNLGRNTGTGDGRVTFDTTFTKNTYIDETRYLQFRVELFNILNHANFSNPGRPSVFDEDGVAVEGAAEIESTQTTNRQIQLSLKLVF